jgi:hypothetical protein
MGWSTMSGPVRVGTNRYPPGRNTGLVTLAQSYDSGNVSAAIGNVDVSALIIPAGSQIYDIVVDQIVIPTATSTFTISVGTTSGGSELMAGVATTAGGRFRGTATAATQLAWQTSTAADTTIFIRNAIGTLATTQGRFIVTVVYVQRDPSGAQNPTTFQN